MVAAVNSEQPGASLQSAVSEGNSMSRRLQVQPGTNPETQSLQLPSANLVCQPSDANLLERLEGMNLNIPSSERQPQNVETFFSPDGLRTNPLIPPSQQEVSQNHPVSEQDEHAPSVSVSALNVEVARSLSATVSQRNVDQQRPQASVASVQAANGGLLNGHTPGPAASSSQTMPTGVKVRHWLLVLCNAIR